MDPKEVLRERLLANREIDANGCWLWTKSRLGHMGYGQTSFPGIPRYRNVLVHRVAAFLWLGFDLDSKTCVLHRCDVPRCFNPDHLWFGTVADNQRDMKEKGRARGGRRPDALTQDEIAYIREQVAAGYTRRQVAIEMGITHTTVNRHAKGLPYIHWTRAKRF